MTEVILAFHRQDLRGAYEWHKDDVYDFLDDVVKHPDNYDVPTDKVKELKTILQNLLRLSLGRGRGRQNDGQDFRARNLSPDQHIYRAKNRLWPRRPQDNSKFDLRRHLHQDMNYWSPYDLLGLFLSSMGPAPIGANKRNFYLPLTAVYGRWCSAIAGHPSGVGQHPCIFQCTWAQRPGEKDQFFLGSSLAGYEFNAALTGTWETVVKRARFNLIDKKIKLDKRWSFNFTPSMKKNGQMGTRFGNCGETYPFLAIFKRTGKDPIKDICNGLALHAGYLDTGKYDDKIKGVIWENTWNPCPNCWELIESLAWKSTNFERLAGSSGAPR